MKYLRVFTLMAMLLPYMTQRAWSKDEITFTSRSWKGSQVTSTTESITDYVVFLNSATLTLGAQGDKYWVVPAGQDITVSGLITVQGEVHIVLCDGATLRCQQGIKVMESDNATLYIHSQSYGNQMGRLIATGAKYYAGIGGSEATDNKKSGAIHIMGGDIEATGGERAAGVGGGGSEEFYESGGDGSEVTIYGGRLTARGGYRAAGIGSGSTNSNVIYYMNKNAGRLVVYDGQVFAYGGDYGAGIGGGCNMDGGQVVVYGGNIYAKGGEDAAGIGGGEDGNGGWFTINGGAVKAEGTGDGAGIGGGGTTQDGRYKTYDDPTKPYPASIRIYNPDGYGAVVTINGGTVAASAGADCDCREDKGGSAIGSGKGVADKQGFWDPTNQAATSLTLPQYYCVSGGDSEGSIEGTYSASDRVYACRNRNYIFIQSCNHQPMHSDQWTDFSYTYDNAEHHTMRCRYCEYSTQQPHNLENAERKCICGKTATSDPVKYIDANGNEQTVADFTVLEGSTEATTLPSGWYVVVGENVEYSNGLNCFDGVNGGDMHLILMDGAKLTVNGYSYGLSAAGKLMIYGQRQGTGQLVVTSTNIGINSSTSITINGGTIKATGNENGGINANNIVINDGTIEANAITATNDILLNGGTVTTTYEGRGFYATSVKVQRGKAFTTAGSNVIFCGTLTPDELTALAQHTLQPINWNESNSQETAYELYKTDHLDLLALCVNGGNKLDGKFFKMTKDIAYDPSALTVDNDGDGTPESNYTAIGTSGYNTFLAFGGNFDGNGHTISGIRLYRGGKEFDDQAQGIFGQVNYTAHIHNLTLADAHITGHDYVGGIAGLNYGNIDGCHVAASVTIAAVQPTAWYHGGIVGLNMENGLDTGSDVSHCTSAATLTAASNATSIKCYGGVVGRNRGTMSDNLAIGATIPASTDNTHGAICGYNINGTLQHNYYTACTVAGVENATNIGCQNADVSENDGAVPALRNQADNTAALALFANLHEGLDLGWGAGKYPVQLADRILYKDGSWNTLCLPFSVDLTADGCPLSGATARTVTEASISGTTLHLKFGDAVTKLNAGTPYLIKWDGDGTSNIENPVFKGVTIDVTKHDYDTNAENVTTDERVRFVGTYKSTAFDGEDKSILLMDSKNKLYYPTTGAGIGAQRAYFKIGDDGALLARRLTSFSIDFGAGKTTGIWSLTATSPKDEESGFWYSLDGRKLVGKPTQKGIYIHHGKKVVIK